MIPFSPEGENNAGELAGFSFELNPVFRLVGFVGKPGGDVTTIGAPGPDDFLEIRDLTDSGLGLGEVIGPDGHFSDVLLTEVSAVPEPSSWLLFVCALAALCAGARRRACDVR